ncbi:MAG TPA: hypothetical protein VJT67_18270 [Longimicrobiaceae bacterium]|nr:hypothetical protein [Longimicrobiaceae bacterium]
MTLCISSRGLPRRLTALCACLLAAACSGAGGTDGGALQIRVRFSGNGVGYWANPGQILTCKPNMTLEATGAGHAIWTGGTSRLTAPYGTYDFAYTAEEVSTMLGAADITAGQTLTAPIIRTGYASFKVNVSFAYAVEGTGQTGTAGGSFDCEAP